MKRWMIPLLIAAGSGLMVMADEAKVVETKDALGNVSKIEMPEFYKLSVSTSITCIDEQYNLVAVLSPKDQDGVTDFSRKVIAFVRADILRDETR